MWIPTHETDVQLPINYLMGASVGKCLGLDVLQGKDLKKCMRDVLPHSGNFKPTKLEKRVD